MVFSQKDRQDNGSRTTLTTRPMRSSTSMRTPLAPELSVNISGKRGTFGRGEMISKASSAVRSLTAKRGDQHRRR